MIKIKDFTLVSKNMGGGRVSLAFITRRPWIDLSVYLI